MDNIKGLQQPSKYITQSDTPPGKTLLRKCLSGKRLTHVSLTLGDSRGQFQPVHFCLDIAVCAEGGIMGALSHVSTHEHIHHVSIHVASSRLGHVSPLSPLLGWPSRHLGTSCSDHLCHWAACTLLIASSLLWYTRPWLIDTRLTDGTFPSSCLL